MKSARLKLLMNRLRILELMMVIGTILFAATAQLVFSRQAIYKAIVIEPIPQLRGLQLEVVERIALTGTWEDEIEAEVIKPRSKFSDTKMASKRRIASARDLEDTHANLSRTEALARAEAPSSKLPSFISSRETSSNAVVALSNGIPMAVVAPLFVQTPSIFEFRPFVNPSTPALVNWLCGHQRTFAGLPAISPSEPAVPVELLPISCRVRL